MQTEERAAPRAWPDHPSGRRKGASGTVPNLSKQVADLVAAHKVLRSSVELFRKGESHMYRVAAVELRKLLCDGKDGNNSLLPQIFLDATLHPIRGYRSAQEREAYRARFGREPYEGLAFQLPATMHFDGQGGVRVTTIVDRARHPISIVEWLEQPLLSQEITVRNFIRSIADKEGAHADREYNSTLLISKSIFLASDESHPHVLIALAEYLTEMLDIQVPNMLANVQCGRADS